MSNRSLAKSPEETTILVTGGAGFIGSHTVVELLQTGYNVVVLDDLSNSSSESLDRVRRIVGLERPAETGAAASDGANAGNSSASGSDRLVFVEASILDREALERVFSEREAEGRPIDAIIHFAGFKAVGESVEKPWEYYWNNIAGTLVLVDVARKHGCKNIVFSSSATVYGEPDSVPLTEHAPKYNATNPYGQTKSMLEQILSDLYVGDNEWNIVLLRYFNPIGAHESGLIGEDPQGIPNNLLPYVAQVAVGRLPKVRVFGDDYDTPDGTGVRDYIHVVDLARGHVAALDWMGGKVGSDAVSSNGSANEMSQDSYKEHTEFSQETTKNENSHNSAELDHGSIAGESAADGTRRGVGVFNLGTGCGSSVLDVIRAFESACGKEIPYEVCERRAGDIAENYASCEKAARELGWVAEYDLARMCEDSWRWQSQNPNGYAAE